MSHPFAVVDLKTTGFSANDRIVEIGVVLLESDGSISDTWETLIRPNRKIPNPDVHGITASMAAAAPRFPEVAEHLGRLLQDRIVVTHDARLKIRMLRREFARLGVELDFSPVCTMQLAGSLPGSPKSLDDCLVAVGEARLAEHDAISDAQGTATLLLRLLDSQPLPTDCAVTYVPPLPTPEQRPAVPRSHPHSGKHGGDDEGVEPPTEVFRAPTKKRAKRRTPTRNTSPVNVVDPEAEAPTEIFHQVSEPFVRPAASLSRHRKPKSNAQADVLTDVFVAPTSELLSVGESKRAITKPLQDEAVANLAPETKAKVEELFEGLAELETEIDPMASWLAGVAERVPKTGDQDADYYLCFLRAVLIDGQISPTAVEALVACAEALGISRDEVQDLHGRFVRQVAIEAWVDGVVTDTERAYLQDAATQLGVDPEIVEELLAEPEEDASDVTPGALFAPGDRVTFTGNLAVPRDAWEARARRVGLDVGEVTPESAVVIAADKNSTSERARRARELDIPIIDETVFARQLSALKNLPVQEEEPVAGFNMVLFPWAAEFSPAPSSVGEVAALWITNHPGEPLYRMSAVLSPDLIPDGLDRNSRIVAGWFADFPNPLNATVHALSELHGVGKLRLQQFVHAVVDTAIELADQKDRSLAELPPADYLADYEDVNTVEFTAAEAFADVQYDDFAHIASSSDADYVVDAVVIDETWSAAPELNADLTHLVQWCTVAAFRPDMPEPVVKWVDALIAQVPDPTENAVAAALAEIDAIVSKDPRGPVIFAGRLQGSRTLDDIGTELGLTRERIRQLEKSLRQRLANESPSVSLLASAVAYRFLPLAPAARVAELLTESGLRTLSAVTDIWELDEGWVCVPGFSDQVAEALSTFSDDWGVCSLSAIAKPLGVEADMLADYLRRDRRLRVEDTRIFTRNDSYQDRAGAALATAGEPMTADEIIAEIGSGNARSMSNQLSADPRFMRVRPETWALSEWGMEEYTTIFDWIARRVDAAGEISLSDLIRDAHTIGAAESSIRTYCSTGEFVIENGVVRRAEAPVVNDASPREVPNFYRRGNTWSLLLVVNSDHLRGSGFGVHRGVCALVDVPFLGGVELPSRLGPQAVRYNRAGSTLGTIRRFLLDLGVGEGDRVWLEFHDDGHFDITRATSLTEEPSVANLMGLDVTREQLVPAVNRALGLQPNAPRRRAVAILRHRYQDDLADMVRELV